MSNKALKILIKTVATIVAFIGVLSFVFYGPFDFVRETWVTSAMTTMTHQWMATTLYDEKTITTILHKHSMVAPKDKTDPTFIEIAKSPSNEIEQLDVSTDNFRAYLLKVHNPNRVKLVACEDLGNKGQKLNEIIKAHNAVAGINGSGFMDSSGHSKGGVPSGLIMSGKKIVFSDKSMSYSIIGIDDKAKLILGNFTVDEIKKSNIVDAVSFSPLLIINGKPTEINGNGGWGIAPRTAIGQTKDGVMLLLVIDGRQLSSFGATIKDIQDIFMKYDAFNAANLDGGSSSIMMYNNKTINFPCTSKTGRYIPSAFIVTKE